MATLTQSNVGGPPPTTPNVPTGGGGGDDRDRPARGGSRSASITGIFVLMCASIMTFASFVSAMVVRRGLNTTDWHRFPLPHILWWNTGVLILSSILIDAARRVLAHNRRKVFNWLWSAAAVLGLAFLCGQIIAWTELEARGFYMAKGPATAFFYVLTWSHAAHVIGALAAVLYVEYRALRWELGPGRRTMVVVSAIFWHFLDVLWLGIMCLFVFWAQPVLGIVNTIVREHVATRSRRVALLIVAANFAFFAALLAAMFYLRVNAPDWPAPFHFASLLMVGAMTMFALTASVTTAVGARAIYLNQVEPAVRWVAIAIANWITFQFLEVVEWVRLVYLVGLGPHTTFGATYLALTVSHWVAVAACVCWMTYVAVDVRRRDIIAIAIYSHFLNLWWIILLFCVYFSNASLQGI